MQAMHEWSIPYMVWRVWLTEILETFQRVFRFEKSCIKENGGKNDCIADSVVLLVTQDVRNGEKKA